MNTAEGSIGVSSVFLWIQRFTQFLGFCPIPLHNVQSAANSFSFLACKGNTIVQLMVFLMIHTYSIIINGVGVEEHSIEWLMNSISIFIHMGAYFITSIEILYNRKQFYEFVSLYARLHNAWAANTVKEEVRLYRSFLLNGVLSFAAYFISKGHEYFALPIDFLEEYFFFYTFYFVNEVLVRLVVAQLLLYVNMIRIELEHFMMSLTQLKIDNSSSLDHKNSCDQIKHLMQLYGDIYKLTELFKKCFGFSLMANFTCAYTATIINIYWIIWFIYQAVSVTDCVLIIMKSFIILQLIAACGDVLSLTQFIAYGITSIKYDIMDLVVPDYIINFLLLLEHQPIRIDVLGCIQLNYSIMHNMLGTIMTYLIFFMQYLSMIKRRPANLPVVV